MKRRPIKELAFLFPILGLAAFAVPSSAAREDPGPADGAAARYDPLLFRRAEIVLRVELLGEQGCDKYCWYEVKVLKTFKAPADVPIDEKMLIAAYDDAPGVPAGESTIYLERYAPPGEKLWKLLGGRGATGVSHVGPALGGPLGSETNPVRSAGPSGEREYLSRLRCPSGNTPRILGRGSVGIGPYGNMLDAYSIVCGDGGKSFKVYMDMYHDDVEKEAVPGFTIDEERGRVE